MNKNRSGGLQQSDPSEILVDLLSKFRADNDANMESFQSFAVTTMETLVFPSAPPASRPVNVRQISRSFEDHNINFLLSGLQRENKSR